MRFSADFIEKVRDSNNIVDVFAEYSQLKRSGSRLMGLCPFPGHNEKTASFSVSEDKQVYHCFGCHRSGQIFTALQELKGLSFPEAVEYLAQKAGLPIPVEMQTKKEDTQVKTKRDKLFKINQYTAQFFKNQLVKSSPQLPARKYCEKRGLTSAIIELFHIGWAPDQWEALGTQLKKAKAPIEMAAELGLIRRKKDGSGYFDIFRDRLMFPILSHKGEYIGFGGRSLTSEQTPKYLNSPESEIFAKGHIFYGLHETAKHIRAADWVVVVEGYMDLIALYAAGIKNVVATLGTALTPHHAKLIKRYTKNVMVLFDGDEAGQAAAERSLPILLNGELFPKAVFLPDELDPDEFIKERGVNALRELFKNARDLFTVVFDRKLLNFRGSASEKVNLLSSLGPISEATLDNRLRDLYIAEIAQKMSVEAQWIQRHLPRATGAEKRPAVTQVVTKDVSSNGAKIKINGAPKAELFLLNISLMSLERFNSIWNSEVVAEMSHPGIQELFIKAEAYHRQMPNEFAKLSAYLMTMTETPNQLGLHLGEPFTSMDREALEKMEVDCIRQVKGKFLRNMTRQLTAELRDEGAKNQIEKLEQIMNIHKSKLTLRRDRES